MNLPQDEGYYIVTPPKSRGGSSEVVKVRFDIEKQEYVVDVIGQPLKYSEEIGRYRDWNWLEKIEILK